MDAGNGESVRDLDPQLGHLLGWTGVPTRQVLLCNSFGDDRFYVMQVIEDDIHTVFKCVKLDQSASWEIHTKFSLRCKYCSICMV